MFLFYFFHGRFRQRKLVPEFDVLLQQTGIYCFCKIHSCIANLEGKFVFGTWWLWNTYDRGPSMVVVSCCYYMFFKAPSFSASATERLTVFFWHFWHLLTSSFDCFLGASVYGSECCVLKMCNQVVNLWLLGLLLRCFWHHAVDIEEHVSKYIS